jgi:sugar/nucleoside kinase (ribokinase family)
MGDTMKTYQIICLGIAVVDILAKPVDRTIFDRDNTLIEDISMYPGGDDIKRN